MPLYEQVLAQLASFNSTEAEGEQVRSRGKWAEERVSNGVAVTDAEGIWESWASFYQYLFTACPVDLRVQSYLLDCLSLSLSVDDAASCDG